MRAISKRTAFYLQKRSKWEGDVNYERPVVMVFNYHGNSLHSLTGIRIAECNWDGKRQRVKVAVKRSAEVNQYLDNLDERLNDIYWKGLAEGAIITNTYILDRLKNREKVAQRKTFWEHYDEYIKLKKTNIRDGTYKALMTAHNRFSEFCTIKKLPVTFEDITPNLLAEYNEYLLSLGNNNNTINSQLKRFKRFMNAAKLLGLHNNNIYKQYSVPETVGPMKFLEMDEIKLLMNVELTSTLEQKTRDLMLMTLYTGLRYGDLHNFKKEDIQQHRFEGVEEVYYAAHIRTIKTSDDIIVPLLPEALSIIKKYESQPGEFALPQLELQVVNEVIKTIGRKAKLNAKQKIVNVKGSESETKYVEKWRVLSTTALRKSFITIAATKGISINVVSSITGQNPATIMKHYLGVLGPDKFKAMIDKMKF